MQTIKICKAITVAIIACYISMVVLNNLLAPQINLEYVRQVMSMETLPASNTRQWRAITSPFFHYVGFILIVALETIAALLCWSGFWKMLQPLQYEAGKAIATSGLTLALLIWIGVFFIVGGEWFLAWKTPWGALPGAIRVVTMVGFTLLFLNLPENN